MKPLHTNQLFIVLLITILIASCKPEDPDVMQPANNPGGAPINENADPDLITNSLNLKNVSVINGDIPAISPLVDLQIDTDTIFWAKGVNKRIRIRKPKGTHVSSYYAQVHGSSSHIEADFEETEETDSLAIIYFDFNDHDWELPITFNIEIVPIDPNGNPLDILELPVLIEDAGSSCNINPYGKIWEWIHTTNNGSLVLAVMNPQITDGTVAGCCGADGKSYYMDCSGNSGHREVDYQSVYMVTREYLKFFESGDVAGELYQYSRNLRASESDFCAGTPGYTEGNEENAYLGTFDFNASDCSIHINELEGQTVSLYDDDGNYLGDVTLPIFAGFGNFATYQLISNHFLKESRGGVDGGGIDRIYEGRTGEFKWYD